VNDGSKDNSLAICTQRAKEDSRIRVVDKKNGGPGDARNAGLNIATGDYIQFVDADDILHPGAIELLVRAIEGHDIVIAHYNMCRYKRKVNKGLIKENTAMDKKTFLNALVRYPGSYYYSALWNKMYSGTLIRQHGLRFNKHLGWAEDSEFNMKYYDKVQSVRFIPDVVYDYFWSVSTGQTGRTLLDLPGHIRTKRQIYRIIRQIYENEGLYQKNKFMIDRFLFWITLSE
jgi:glycosyltransferase involved in cell wall biosynthesis